MIVGSVSEDKNIEKRVAITPEIIKKYKSIGLDVNLCKNYASHLGIKDDEYISEGANILTIEEVLEKSNVIAQMGILNDENLNKLKQNQNLIGVINPYLNEAKLKEITKKKSKLFCT